MNWRILAYNSHIDLLLQKHSFELGTNIEKLNTNMFGPSLDLLLHSIHTSVPISLYRFTMVSRIVQMVGNKTRVFISSKDAVFLHKMLGRKKGSENFKKVQPPMNQFHGIFYLFLSCNEKQHFKFQKSKLHLPNWWNFLIH